MKKRKKLAIAVLSALSAATLAVGVGCTPKKTSDGSEYGVYYYEWDGEEYLVTLSEGEKFTFCVDGENRTGTYRLDAGKLTLKFGKKDVIEAAMDADVLTLTYNESEMRFLKRTAYTVEFEENGGSEIASVRVINGKTLARPEESVKSGYTFIGWYADAEYTKPFIFGSDIITGDTTLYAYWVQNTGAAEYKVSFDLNYKNAEALESRTTVGGKLYEIPTPVREGYDFNGWWVSVYNDASKLTYRYTSETMLTEDTTLYASWKETGSRKLDAPVVRIESNRIVWEGVNGATGYRVVVADASGKELLNTTGNLSVNFDFGKQAAGDYVVTVTAMASASANNAESVIYYKNKALGKVSNFSVVEGTTLLYGAVDNAEHYIITVECGNAHHNHTEFDNGTATSYNFTNCTPKADGTITFTVVATAEGYASGTASSYSHSKVLSKIERLYTDSATDTISWDSVANATRYIVAVNGKRIDVGTKTSYSLAEYEAGEIEVSVYPETEGYISPEATSVKYVKTSVAKPTELKIVDETLTWNAVSGATYEVRVNDANAVAANTNEFDLSAYNLTQDRDHVIAVRAIKGSSASAWTEIVVRSNAMSETLRYGGGKVSWTLAIGATAYEVSVNGRVQKTVTDGSNEAEVTLDRAGTNVIGVRYTDGANYSTAASIEVYAHRVYYYSNGGAGSEEQYKAVGDPMTPPEVTRAGYDFEGWYNVPGGAESNGKKYEDAIFREAGEIMLFAYYTPKTYKATLNAQGGIMDATVEEVVYRTSDFKFAVPTAASATDAFDGWYTQQGGQGIRLTDAEGKGVARWDMARDAEIYANWINNVFEFLPLSDGTYSVKRGANIGSVTTAVVPATYNGKPVAVVEGYAFESCKNLIHIAIPDTVKIIETNTAFSKCTKLETVDIYKVDGNTQRTYWSEGGVIFAYNDVTTATEIAYVPAAMTGDFVIPDGVTTIPMKAFSGTKITSVTIPTSVTSVEMSAFYNCSKLLTVEFVGGGMNELTIADKAFQSCTALADVNIPARTGQFKTTVFDRCTGLKAINVEAGNLYYSSVNGMLCTADGATLVYAPKGMSGRVTVPVGVTSIANEAFSGNTALTQIYIPGYVTSVGEKAFFKNTSLKAVVFQGNAVEDMTIGAEAFEQCANLRTVTFDETCRVAEIGANAFYGCASLRALTIPGSMKKIGNNAFEKCESLRSVRVEGSETEMEFGSSIFLDCTNLTNVYLSANVRAFSGSLFSGCDNLDNIEVDENNPYLEDDDGILYDKGKKTLLFYPLNRIDELEFPETITAISDAVFAGCLDLTEITIPAAVTYLGDNIFDGCIKLKTVTIPADSKLETIGEYAFRNTQITEIFIPASVKTIRLGAFTNTKDSSSYNVTVMPLTNVTFGENSQLEEIGERAFYLSNLATALNFPASLKTVGQYAFANCADLPGVTFAQTDSRLASMGYRAFWKCTSIQSVEMPGSLASLPQDAFSGCAELASVTLHEGLTSIGTSAFSSCSKLTAIELPNSVTSIGGGAFNGCKALTSFSFKDDSQLATIGNSVFAGTGITAFQIPKHVRKIESGAFSTDTIGNSKLKTLTVHPENENFKAVDNVLYDFAVTRSILVAPEATTITVPGTVTTIGNNSFRTSKVSSLTFEESNVPLQIGDSMTATTSTYCFYRCQQLATLTLPARLTGIGRYAFSYATRLKTITFESAPAAAASETEEEEPIAKESQLATIANNAFDNCSALASIKIPKSVTTIGANVFNKCAKLVKVEFDKDSSLTEVPAEMFKGATGNFTVTFPDSIKSIGYRAFYGCTGLTSFDFGGTKITTIGEQAFQGCTKLATVDFTDSEVVTIGSQAFRNTVSTAKLKNLKFTATAEGETDSKVQTIGERAFARSIVESVTLPASLQSVGDCAFAFNEKLKTIVFKSRATDENGIVPPFELGTQTAAYSGTTSGLSGSSYTGKTCHVFAGCKLLESVTLPNGLTDLKAGVFYKCVALKNVTLPSGVTSLGAEAFSGCTALASITIPDTVEEIAADSFSGCTALSAVTATGSNMRVENGMLIRNNLVLLFAPGAKDETGTFITSVVIPDGITAIGASAFRGNANLTSVVIPASVETIGDYAFRGLTNLETLTFKAGDANLSFGEYAFAELTSLQSVAFPARLSSMGRYAFYNAVSLTAADLTGTRITEIPERAFYNSSSTSFELKTVKLSASVTAIGGYAFSGNKKLQSVTFGTGSRLQTVGPCAFYEAFQICEEFASVEFPSTLSSIGQGCFQNCYKLQSVDFGKNSQLSEIPQLTFQNCLALERIVIPASVTSIGKSAFNKINGNKDPEEIKNAPMQLQSVVFEDGSKLETVGQSAFGYVVGSYGDVSNVPCVNLTTVDFGKNSSLTTIMQDAFHGCEKLEFIRIPYSVTQIDARAFKDCTSLKEISLAEGITAIGEQVFDGCTELAVLDLPESLATIGAGAFNGCGQLSLNLSNSNAAYTVADGILYDFDLTTIVFVPTTLTGEVTVPDTITTIADGAFSSRSITKITIPTSVRVIGNNVFADCSELTEVVLHDRIQSIGNYAFKNTALSEITIGRNVTTIGDGAFEGCASLTDVIFEFGVDWLTLGNAAFKNCTALESIEIPQRVRGKYDSSKYKMYYGIGGSCFEGCTKLKNVTFEADLGMLNDFSLTFGNAAFKDCASLESMVIPNYCKSITYSDGGGGSYADPAIGADCFVGCEKFSSITFPTFAPSILGSSFNAPFIIGARAFKGLKQLKSIEFNSVTGLYESAFEESGLESVVIPKTLQSTYYYYYGVYNAAFKNCKSLRSVTINSEKLNAVYMDTFDGCSALEEITVPATVSTIESRAFRGCTNLQRVIFAQAEDGTTKIKTISANAFENCTSLTEFAIPSTVTEIRTEAFKNCTALASVTLPATVTTLGANVFSGWTATQTVNMGIAESAVPSTWDENWRTGCDANVVWASSVTE